MEEHFHIHHTFTTSRILKLILICRKATANVIKCKCSSIIFRPFRVMDVMDLMQRVMEFSCYSYAKGPISCDGENIFFFLAWTNK